MIAQLANLAVGLGIGSALAALITALFNRKKVAASAASELSGAGSGVAKNVEGFLDRLLAENSRLATELQACTAAQEAARLQNMELTSTLRELTAELREHHPGVLDGLKHTARNADRLVGRIFKELRGDD